ncbi:MAG: hypothetical protein ACRDE7_10455 [Sphingobacterium sp.]
MTLNRYFAYIKIRLFELIHSNIPEEEYAGIVEGWDGVYLASLTDFFKED